MLLRPLLALPDYRLWNSATISAVTADSANKAPARAAPANAERANARRVPAPVDADSDANPRFADRKAFHAENLHAVNANTGKELWKSPICGSAEWSSPVVADGVVYFGGNDNYLYAVAT
ncbi:PQQ-binding-like beta-propeller repeat protein [Saccharopolyspora shandongensis]|uniref:PQQ-binding-like beta-propeller repeat protein n=1 Tax=Saccharopolyspora shandongensis TaxID=418495 RepID=UPI003427D14B